jgi:hypothetical protein
LRVLSYPQFVREWGYYFLEGELENVNSQETHTGCGGPQRRAKQCRRFFFAD